MQRASAAKGLVGIAAILFAGCSSDEGSVAPNQPPDTEITSSVPGEGESVPHQMEIRFSGRDADGTVPQFEYLLHTYPRSTARWADIVVPQPAVNDPRWGPARGEGTNFAIDLIALADTLRADPRGDIGDGHFDRWHTVFVRAIDNEGARDESPDSRTFSAFTLAPALWLLEPALPNPQVMELPRTFVMHWNGVDDIGDGRTQNPVSVRWVLTPVAAADVGTERVRDLLYDLSEDQWGEWLAWGVVDSTREARLSNVLTSGDAFFAFAVQGLDDGGAITPQFGDTPLVDSNFGVLHVRADLPVGPRVPVRETQVPLGDWLFEGDTAPAIVVDAAGVDSVTLAWGPMETRHYGGTSRDYRYGWEITNPSDDQQWSPWSVLHVAPPHPLTMTESHFFLQARDHIGQITTAHLIFTKF